VRKTVTDWLRLNPEYRLSNDPANTDTLSSWIRDTQGREWNAYVNEMAKAKVILGVLAAFVRVNTPRTRCGAMK
jgi:hypothetical protein